ncbi:MAG: lipocalin family protein [Prevotella sp.]|uniref:lipocalin family protein n=1 Tax=Prevotella sp. TaxID=59823 RepID=UPI0025875CB6|nr:lipocalin family protein [Prevotella sp.]MDD6854568.1 lipocalin family protein [Prevotella sp.]
MKKITRILTVLAVAVLPFAFTSCDDDYDYWYGDTYPWWYNYHEDDGRWDYGDNNDDNPGNTLVDEAQVLNGEWNGTMAYTNGSDGTTNQFYATMTFVQNNSNAIKGTGTEYDYYRNADGSVANSQTLHFSWYINNNGDIYVKYDSGSTFVMDMNASQHGFYLDEATGIFRGYMIGTNNSDLIQFDFTRQTSGAKGSKGLKAVSPKTTTFGADVVDRISLTGKMSLPGRR